MALPSSRNTTYVAGVTDVKANDLNAIQDMIIGGKAGDWVLDIPGTAGRANANTTFPSSGYEGTIESTGATTIVIPVPLKVGDRIKSVICMISGNTTVDFTAIDVIKLSITGGSTNLGTTSSTNVPAAITPISIDNTDHTLVAGDYIFVGFVINATAGKVWGIRVTGDRP